MNVPCPKCGLPLHYDDPEEVPIRHASNGECVKALRAALDQERAKVERLRGFAQDCEDILGYDEEIAALLNAHELTDMDGRSTALLSGRGEVSDE